MTKMTVKCESFKPLRRNTLCGFCEIMISELHLRIKDIAIHEKGNSRWAQLPARPLLKDGAVVKDDGGKTQYFPVMQFANRDVADAFSAAVVKAVLECEPTAFDDEQPKSTKQSAPYDDDPIPF